MATYNLTKNTPSKIRSGDILNCPYDGYSKPIVLPKGMYLLEVWGAQGGYRNSSDYGGKGGYAKGTITLTAKKTDVFLYAGGSGNTGIKENSIYKGGFNGGGYRYNYYGGGGASDVRIGNDSLYARVIVAGGGGSDGAANKHGMYGGGETGGDATESCGTIGYGGTATGFTTTTLSPLASIPITNGSSSTAGGFGFGGFGCYSNSGYAGAGGGGWYGGCGSYPDGSGDDDRGGGGGSGYIYTKSSAVNYPAGCLLDESNYLSNASMLTGNESLKDPNGSISTGHAGNGYVRITVLEASTSAFYVKINGEWKEI